MQQIINNIRNRAAAFGKSIVLPESEDPRILKAAVFLEERHICRVIMLGQVERIRKRASEYNISGLDTITLENIDVPAIDPLVDHLYKRRRHQGLSKEEAAEQLTNSLYRAATMIAVGEADGGVAGSVTPTSEVIRVALHTIGLRKNVKTLSSTFLMVLKDGRTFTYADCGVVPYPDAEQLAEIAVESARTHQLLTREKPIVAMLSFSTKGSASHERVTLVTKALTRAKSMAPELTIDGELQFDAALIPEVAEQKAAESMVAGKANVFIFPNLDAANIGYKITERLAGAMATGPILQGLNKPFMDLSRGCTWQDIVNAACVAILMTSSPEGLDAENKLV